MHDSIRLTKVGYNYTADTCRKIFSGIDISLKKGEIFCLLGANGSGKSTLLKCIVNLLPGFEGDIMIGSRPLKSMSPETIASKVGYVPQSLVSTFPFTVENIVVMGRASRIGLISTPSGTDIQKASDAMERISISHLAGRSCSRLSGGEWQMVLIARALTQSPDILILDEPTSHLDIGNQVRILEVADHLARQGMTILMASHFPDHAFLHADQVGILKNGRMEVKGVPDEVLTESVLSGTYGVDIGVIKVEGQYQRKICLPRLRISKKDCNEKTA